MKFLVPILKLTRLQTCYLFIYICHRVLVNFVIDSPLVKHVYKEGVAYAPPPHETTVSDEIKNCLEKKYRESARGKHNVHETQLTNVQVDNTPTGEKKRKKKITIEVDEDDPCLKEKEIKGGKTLLGPGDDPRFQQQNQTLRCWVMYTDFYRCEHILGAESSACAWFKQVFKSICPNNLIHHWDDLRSEGKFSWHKYRTQGEFPGDKYGV